MAGTFGEQLCPLLAVTAMLGSSLTVIGNAIRISRAEIPDPAARLAVDKMSEIMPEPVHLGYNRL